MFRVEPAVLPAVNEAGQRARWPALFVQVLRLQDLLEEPQLVIRIEDGEVWPKSNKLSMHAQDLYADRMERAEPRHPLVTAGEQAHPVPHLARGLVGEGDGEDFMGARPSRRDQMGDTRREDPSLADARAGEHEHRSFQQFDRAQLFGVQAREVGWNSVRIGVSCAPASWLKRRKTRMVWLFGSMRHGTNHAPAT